MNEMTELTERLIKNVKNQTKRKLARPVCAKKMLTYLPQAHKINNTYIAAAAEDVQNNASEFALG